MAAQDIITIFFSDYLTVVLTLLLVVIIAYKVSVQRSSPAAGKLPPSFPWLPIVGSYPWLDMGRRGLFEVTLEMAKKHNTNITMCYIGNARIVVLHDYLTIKEAYIKQADVFSKKVQFHVFARELVGYGVISNNGPSWKMHRKFALQSLRDLGVGKQSLEGKIGEELEVLVAEFDAAGGRAFDPGHYVSNAVSNIICSIVFGHRYRYSDEKFKHLLELLDFIFKSSRYGLLLQSVPMLWCVRKYFKYNEISGAFRDLLDFIQRHITEHKRTFDPAVTRDFMDAYIKEMYDLEQEQKDNPEPDESQVFNEKHLQKLVFDVFAAGSETTNTTLRWGLLYMSLWPEVQERVQREIDGACADAEGGELSYSSLERVGRMPYTEACIMEIQRLGNIAPLALVHATTRDTQLQGYHIPKDTWVMPNLWACHLDPKYWRDPLKFDPGRFLDPADGKLLSKPDSFMPFSTGRRVCLGEPLARMELFLFFTTLMRHFTISQPAPPAPPPSLVPDMGLTLSPKPYHIVATRRNPSHSQH